MDFKNSRDNISGTRIADGNLLQRIDRVKVNHPLYLVLCGICIYSVLVIISSNS